MTLKSPTRATGTSSSNSSATLQPLEPAELVVELRAGCGIAVWKVQASDHHSIDRCLDVAAVAVVGVAWKSWTRFARLLIADEDRNAIPGFLAVPDRTVRGALYLSGGDFSSGAFSSCRQTTSAFATSSHRSSTSSPSVDAPGVVRGELHPSVLAIALVALARLGVVFGIVARVG
jgi:hypothetical protein